MRFENNLPYFIVAAAPSMNGYASVGAAMIVDGMKVTYNAHFWANIPVPMIIIKFLWRYTK